MATIYSERMFTRWEAELGPVADELGLPRAIFHRPDVEYPLEKYYRLLEGAARRGPANIGMRIGSAMRPGDLGALGHAAAAAPVLGQSLALIARYLYVFAHGNVVRVDAGVDRVVVTYQLTDAWTTMHRQDIELATSFLATLMRALSGRALDPVLVEFECTKPDHAAALREHFGCEIRWSQTINRLHYRKSVLDLAVQSSDPSLFEALDFFLAERLKVRAEDCDLVDKVRHLVGTALGDHVPDIDRIADMLGLSRRTLQRRLTQEGVVFSELVDDVRRSIADDYLRSGDYSLTDIALMLGYSELSSFSRAFRRWTGRSPQEVKDRKDKAPPRPRPALPAPASGPRTGI